MTRRTKLLILVVCVVAVATAAIVTALLLRREDEYVPPYSDMLEELGIDRESSDSELEQAMEALADEFLTQCPAGVSIAVTRNGTRIVVPRGVLDVEGAEPITQDTLFEIGSVSKPMTGLALAIQVVAGDLNLDTPLNALLPDSVPELLVNGTLVTFRQLVTHTAGFPRLAQSTIDTNYKDFTEPNPYAGFTEEDLFRDLTIASSQLSQSGEPEYSNFGFSTLSYLLSRNRNTTFPELQKGWTDRLGMNNTWMERLPEFARDQLVTKYYDGDVVPYWYNGGLYINGAGSTLSSTRDMLTYVEALMAPEEKVQDEGLIASLTQSLESLFETSDSGGYAFSWAYEGTPRYWAHTGSTGGSLAFAAFQPETRAGVVVMSNCGSEQHMYQIGGALTAQLFLLAQA